MPTDAIRRNVATCSHNGKVGTTVPDNYPPRVGNHGGWVRASDHCQREQGKDEPLHLVLFLKWRRRLVVGSAPAGACVDAVLCAMPAPPRRYMTRVRVSARFTRS